ncbi:acyltransferase [Anaerostipes hadrus]|nr:acyltransferase [Anaerostipes hadrus]
MLTKKDAKMAQGLAIIGMIALHLFCRIDNLPYNVHIFIRKKPLIYFIGLFGDCCVPIYCFCSGYAQQIMYEKEHKIGQGIKRLPKFIVHFWIIVILFSLIGILYHSLDIPRTISDFIGNILLYKISYNGAWWFVLTYIWLVLLYPIMKRLADRLNPVILICISGILYVIFYYFEIIHTIYISNSIIAWIWNQLCLIGRTQFAFISGMICCKYLVMDKIRNLYMKVKMKNLCLLICVAVTFIFHCFVQSLIVAPITGMMVLMCLHLWDKPDWIERLFLLLGKHSTNIWLIHMFFYLILFKNFIFKLKEPILIFIGMIIICIAVSILINQIEKIIIGAVRNLVQKN